jgi:hypothetical protein
MSSMSARKKKPKKPAAKGAGKRTSKKSRGTQSKRAGQARSAKPKRQAPGRSASRASKRPAGPSKAELAKAKKAAAAKLAKEREQARVAKEKERAQKEKERAKEKAQREREAALNAKEKERAKAAAEKEKARAAAEKAKEKARAEKEKEREKAAAEKEKEREKAAAEKEKEREKAAAEKEKKRLLAEKEAEKARLKKEAEARRAAEKAEKEAEKRRELAEREAAKEEARRQKEEERARREAEREAYRLAKEAERERLRAEREAARRVRESKVARASKAAQRVDGMRGTRVYDPAAIPNQSGTSRVGGELPGRQRLVGVRPVEPGTVAAPAPNSHPPASPPIERRPTPPPVMPVQTTPDAVEQRYKKIQERLVKAGEPLLREYEETLEMSWIHHDSALEGVVYTFQELRAAMDPSSPVVPDSSLQPVCEEIRRHRQAIAYVRDLGERKRVPLNVDVVKKLFVILHPEEGDVKTVKYRKDIPQHRLYFHEYTAPDKIAYRVRQIMDWLNGPEAKKMKNPLRVGARVHYDLLRVFPFAQDSGKVARLLMNIILLRGGYPPAIVHSTERQRYYEALKGQLNVIIQLVNESISNALASIEKRLDDHEARAAS